MRCSGKAQKSCLEKSSRILKRRPKALKRSPAQRSAAQQSPAKQSPAKLSVAESLIAGIGTLMDLEVVGLLCDFPVLRVDVTEVGKHLLAKFLAR